MYRTETSARLRGKVETTADVADEALLKSILGSTD